MFVIWLLTAGAVAITVVAVLRAGLVFVHAAPFFELFGSVIAGLVAINIWQRVRMRENERSIFLIDMIVVYMIMALTMMIYQYAAATRSAIPISSIIERWDHWVHFDWFSFASYVNAKPYFSEILEFCYTNWMREFIVALLLMAYFRKFADTYEFTVAYIVAGMATLSVTAFWDSEVYEAVASYAIPGFHTPVGVAPETIEKVASLRSGADRTFDCQRVIGLVSFPSFHAGSALLLATATRNLKFFWAPFLIFNLLIVVGTITAGGHNLMDVLGGCAFALGGLAVARAGPLAQRRAPVQPQYSVVR